MSKKYIISEELGNEVLHCLMNSVSTLPIGRSVEAIKGLQNLQEINVIEEEQPTSKAKPKGPVKNTPAKSKKAKKK